MYLSIKGYSKETIEAFYNVVKEGSLNKPGEHVLDEIVYKGVNITFYKTGTVLFNGNYKLLEKEIETLIDPKLYVGIDEVGVGENIGPYVSCAVKFNNYNSKKNVVMHGIKDSKKMKAHEVAEAAEVIKANAEVHCVVLEPQDFNVKYKQVKNMKALNALAQNSILLNYPKDNEFVTDEFVNENKYKEYMETFNVKEVRDIKLVQKAEDKYMEVAAGAIVAKAYFNNWLVEFTNEHNLPLQIKDRVNANKLWSDIKEGRVQFDKPELLLKDWSKE